MGSIVQFLVDGRALLAQPADWHTAECWMHMPLPDGWEQFPQAVRLVDRLNSALGALAEDIADAEAEIAHNEWANRNWEDGDTMAESCWL